MLVVTSLIVDLDTQEPDMVTSSNETTAAAVAMVVDKPPQLQVAKANFLILISYHYIALCYIIAIRKFWTQTRGKRSCDPFLNITNRFVTGTSNEGTA